MYLEWNQRWAQTIHGLQRLQGPTCTVQTLISVRFLGINIVNLL